jgi:hypothetical protein
LLLLLIRHHYLPTAAVEQQHAAACYLCQFQARQQPQQCQQHLPLQLLLLHSALMLQDRLPDAAAAADLGPCHLLVPATAAVEQPHAAAARFRQHQVRQLSWRWQQHLPLLLLLLPLHRNCLPVAAALGACHLLVPPAAAAG